MKSFPARTHVLIAAVFSVFVTVPHALAAQEASPEAQAWIDIATFSGMGMPMGGMAGMGASPMSALGGMFGGKGSGGANSFGNTRTMTAGRWVDVTVRTRANPHLDEAQQAVPQGFLSPALELKTPKNAPPAPARDDEDLKREDPERPKGRMLLYWGCGSAIRSGQPKVLDMATAGPAISPGFLSGAAPPSAALMAPPVDRCGPIRKTAAWCLPRLHWWESTRFQARAFPTVFASRYLRHRT